MDSKDEWCTYRKPVAKTAHTPSFFLKLICNGAAAIIGSAKMTMSLVRLMTPLKMPGFEFWTVQVPAMRGFQTFSTGQQGNIQRNRVAVYAIVMMAMIDHEAQ
jgi:hypothetical protein